MGNHCGDAAKSIKEHVSQPIGRRDDAQSHQDHEKGIFNEVLATLFPQQARKSNLYRSRAAEMKATSHTAPRLRWRRASHNQRALADSDVAIIRYGPISFPLRFGSTGREATSPRPKNASGRPRRRKPPSRRKPPNALL